uniref:Uncharacterized protein n=1 Tax=Vitis vinifera TaxID=29760 RepID=A5CB36_VITVI|nr:hypothetical protein VITISV_008887 [Vitis vinifera]
MSITASITRPRYIVFASLTIIPELFIDMSSQRSVVRDSLAFRAAVHSRFTTFRVASSVSTFRVVITSQFDVQSHHHHFSISAFRAIIGFQIDIQSPLLGFRRSESLSLLSFGVQKPSSVFRSTFRVPSSVSAFRVVITSQCDVQSHHHHFPVSAFRAIIDFQIDIQSRILGFGVQSRYHFSVWCSEPSSLLLSVSAFRAIIDFQIDVQSRVLGFGVQSRYRFSASVFRVIITTSLSFGVQSHHRFSDRHSESHPRFRRSESLSLLSLTFRVIIITS